MSNLFGGGDDGAKRAAIRERDALEKERAGLEVKQKKERERAQRLFIRQMRARQGGGFFEDSAPKSDTLG